MRCAVGATLGAMLAACYTPVAPDGAPCGEGGRCPTGQTCVASPTGDRCFSDPALADAPPVPGDGPPPDVTVPVTCTPRRLLTGGTDVGVQGWQIVREGTATVTYAAGVTILDTTADARQVIVLHGAFPPDRWALDFTVEVTRSGGHATTHAAAALMASFHDPVGDAADRARMIYLDETALGFGNGATSISFDTKRVVTYRLERTAPSGNGGDAGIKLTAAAANGGSLSVSSGPFVSNGSVAIGDQTREPGLDSTLRISSIDLSCP